MQTIVAAWAHYEREHDPPGFVVYESDGRWYFCGTGVVHLVEGADHESEAVARAAAWAWYWRRIAVADTVEFGDPAGDPDDFPRAQDEGIGSVWPRCLAWPDEQVAAVERWLAEDGDLPPVLRA